MHTFRDSATGQYWQFDDDVQIEFVNGRWTFANARGDTLDAPETLEPAVLPDPAGPAITELKARKLAEINAAFEAAAHALTGGYPEAEQLTWPVQRAEALAWQSDPSSPTPYLDGLAAARGIEPEEMRQKTLTQTLLFMAASQQLVGKRQRLRDALDAIEDDAVDAAAQIGALAWD